MTNITSNFEITGPDDDGLLWLVLHGSGTTGRAMFNLGSASSLAGQVAMLFEVDRRAALAAPEPAFELVITDQPIVPFLFKKSEEKANEV